MTNRGPEVTEFCALEAPALNDVCVVELVGGGAKGGVKEFLTTEDFIRWTAELRRCATDTH